MTQTYWQILLYPNCQSCLTIPHTASATTYLCRNMSSICPTPSNLERLSVASWRAKRVKAKDTLRVAEGFGKPSGTYGGGLDNPSKMTRTFRVSENRAKLVLAMSSVRKV